MLVKGPKLPRNRTEQELLDALERIENGAPKDPALIKRSKRGALRVTISTVAQEAGFSRTLISHDRCAYPKVRAKILALRAPSAEPMSLAEINRRLRQDNAELRRSVKLARDSMAAMALRMNRVVKEAERRIAMAERRRSKKSAPGDKIAGRFKDEFPGQDSVVAFPTQAHTTKKETGE